MYPIQDVLQNPDLANLFSGNEGPLNIDKLMSNAWNAHLDDIGELKKSFAVKTAKRLLLWHYECRAMAGISITGMS